MKIIFEKVKKSDIGTIINMMKKLYEYDRSYFNEKTARPAFDKLLENDSFGKAFSIYADDILAGYIIITFGYSIEYHGRDAFIDELFIEEKFRRKGIGSEAINFVEKICKAYGIEALHLEVERENLNAQKVYRRKEFKDHSRYLMTKWIKTDTG